MEKDVDHLDLIELKGAISDCEQNATNEYYYFSMQNEPNRLFYLTRIECFSLEQLEQISMDESNVVLEVSKIQYLENNNGTPIEVYTFSGKGATLTLDQYIQYEKKDCLIMIVLGMLIALGMLFCIGYVWKFRNRA